MSRFKNLFRGYILHHELEEFLTFRKWKPEPDTRPLPDTVFFGKFRVVFNECAIGGYRVDVFHEGKRVAESVKVSRFKEREVDIGNGRQLLIKLGLLDPFMLHLCEVELD